MTISGFRDDSKLSGSPKRITVSSRNGKLGDNFLLFLLRKVGGSNPGRSVWFWGVVWMVVMVTGAVSCESGDCIFWGGNLIFDSA